MKIKALIATTLMTGLLLVGCGDITDNRIMIFLHLDNGQQPLKVDIKPGTLLSDLEIPTRVNSVFDKWYKDVDLQEEYPTLKIYNPIQLYAGYKLDQPGVENLIYADILESVVTVEVHNQVLLETTKMIAQGSGVIFHRDGGYYYALTNNHVTVEPQEYDVAQTIFIYDDDQNIAYPAEKIHELNDYDLAIVKFYSPETYNIPHISLDPLHLNRDVVAIGTPEGAYNTITYGKTRAFGTVSVSDQPYLSNVEFPVIVHSAEINHGSSGGPLFDYKFDIVGINFASGESDSDGPLSVAIPSEKIIEYFEIVGGIFSDYSSL